MHSACTIDGCTKRRRSQSSPYCEMHYYRLRRTGTTDDPPERLRCSATGCGRTGTSKTPYCRMHLLRLRVRGDVDFEYRDENNHMFVGDAASYSTVHQRLARARGRASDYPCVACGCTAAQWAYDHTDPHERTEDGMPFSTDLDRYQPRCVPCHKAHDLARIAARSLGDPS